MNEISINTKNQVVPDRIIYFKADINYSIAYYDDGRKKIIVKSLKHIESKLSEHGFYRIHKSFLVNLDYIYQKPSGGYLQLPNDHELLISRRRLSGFRKKLKSINKNVQNLSK